MKRSISLWTMCVLVVAACHDIAADAATISITTPMAPPNWALLERELLRANTVACQEYYDKYYDERGYLLCVERWGANDGPDDAIESVADWPILHMLGAPDSILEMYKQAWEGHLRQYTEAKTVDVPFARDGMYYKEFPTMMDWMHNGEGLRVFNLQGLSDPHDLAFGHRVRRYAGFYMNEDPQAPNYDPRFKIIRSMFNGSRGPLMRKATGLDWVGDPIEVAGRFAAGHGERNYAEMVAHFKDYNDIVGDHPQNMCATSLAANAYLLTGEPKYKQWLLEYVDAWYQRTIDNHGIIPTKIGLDGTIGGATDGKWYGGAYGWGFSVEVPQTGETAHRNRAQRGLIGFANAYLLTGNRRYIDIWTRMIDHINANRKTVDGQVMYPHMYGDQGWYDYRPQKWNSGALDCYFWTCDPKNLTRVATDNWIRYLQGEDPDFPARALRSEFEHLRSKARGMREDTTTPDTRLADDPMRFNPATVTVLRQLMLAGLDPGRAGALLHCRLRYFDPDRRRAGIPEDVAALIDTMTDQQVAVTLVNVSQSSARTVVVQTGAYGEHQCTTLLVDDQEIEVDHPWFTIHLEAGTGARLVVNTKRYANQPRFAFPWDSFGK